MNFLEICKKVNQVGEFQGDISSVMATGYQAELVEAVRQSFIDIQLERTNWNFLRRDVTFSITPATTTYLPTTLLSGDFLSTWNEKLILYNFLPVRVIDYDASVLMDPSKDTPSTPNMVAIRPYDSALIFNKVNGTYPISAHYYLKPQILVNNIDTPIMPSEHHYLIVHLALMNLVSIISSEIYQKAVINYNKSMGYLLRKELPQLVLRKRAIA
jgi:hypothetical protein